MSRKWSDDLIDTRMIEDNIKRGKITREEYENYLASLPDLKNQAREIRPSEEQKDTHEEVKLTFLAE